MEHARQVILDLLLHFIELAKGIQKFRKENGYLRFEDKQELRRIRLILNTVDVYAIDPSLKTSYEELLGLYREMVPEPSRLG